MKNIFLTLLIINLFSCSPPNKGDSLSADSTRTTTDSVITSVSAETPDATNRSTPVPELSGADSLFNFLARKQIVRGAFGDVKLLTDKLIDPNNLNAAQNRVALLVHSGEGEGYSTQFAKLYTLLAVVELQGDHVTLVDVLDLGEATSYGLRENSTDGDSIMLAENKFAARVLYHSSEEGAGDSGYRSRSAEVYVLLNGKLAKVFENNIEDFSFASNEVDSYGEHTITTTFTILQETSNGLFNLQINTDTVLKGSEEQPNKEGTKQDERQRDGTYQWNGKIYEWVKDN